MQGLDRVLEIADHERPGGEPALGTGPSRGEAPRDVGVARPARATRPLLGQLVELEGSGDPRGQVRDPTPVQPLHAAKLLAPVEPDEGRDRVGVQPRGHLEVAVDGRHRPQSQPRGLGRGLLGRGLREDPDGSPGGRGGVEDGEELVARGAVVLDEGDQLGGHHGRP